MNRPNPSSESSSESQSNESPSQTAPTGGGDRRSRLSNRRAKMDPELYARLVEESKAPYRGLRRFIYFAVGASGMIGLLIFTAQLAAGQAVASTLPNLAVQLGAVALAVFLFRIDRPRGDR